MYNKEMIKDFINYGIIASVFLLIPYDDTIFLCIVLPLIFDLIELYLVERKEKKNVII